MAEVVVTTNKDNPVEGAATNEFYAKTASELAALGRAVEYRWVDCWTTLSEHPTQKMSKEEAEEEAEDDQLVDCNAFVPETEGWITHPGPEGAWMPFFSTADSDTDRPLGWRRLFVRERKLT